VPVIISTDESDNKKSKEDIQSKFNNVETSKEPEINKIEGNKVDSMDIALPEALFENSDYSMNFPDTQYSHIQSSELEDLGIDDVRLKTLINDYVYHHGYFISPTFKTTKLDKQSAILAGGKIGWTMNREITIGLSMNMLTQNITSASNIKNSENNKEYLQFGFGGIYLEYVNSSNSLVHFTFNSTFGFGGYKNANYKYETQYGTPWGIFMLIEPEANIELNLSNQLRIGMSASYRITDTFKNNNNYKLSPGIDLPELDGLAWGLYFKYGIF
jgi:hypothetical protein